MSTSRFSRTRRTRRFIHLLLWGIFSMSISQSAAQSDNAAASPDDRNDLAVRFDSQSGRFSVLRRSGETLVRNATARAETAAGVRATTDPEYIRTVKTEAISDAIGEGTRTTLMCVDKRKELDITVHAAAYRQPNALVIEAVLRNASSSDLVIPSAMPLHGMSDGDDGACFWPGVSKVLTNGKMYYDPGKVLDFGPGDTAEGWWNSCFYKGDGEEGLVIGYLGNPTALGEIRARRAGASDDTRQAGGEFSLRAVSSYQDGFILRPGGAITSDRIILLIGSTPYDALEAYAECLKRIHDIRLNRVENGWCSWFSYFGSISESEVLRNAAFAADHLKRYGFDVIQVDDGFQRGFGDWEGNDRFPGGMKNLADRIRALGLTPGIWIAPYAIGAGSQVFKDHPDWVLRLIDGRLQNVHPYLPEEHETVQQMEPKIHALDISHPGAAQWLHDMFDLLANGWGYDFIKTDFVDWTLLAAHNLHDPAATRAGLYRKGNEIMRKAMGPDKHLLDCGPGPITLGTFDSMRIELDQPPVLWQQYFGNSASSGPAAAKRYYFHNRTWINDADHLVMMYLTTAQSQAAATILALSGGTVMSGDRLYDLDASQLDILRKILPAYGKNARPIDLFERDIPEIFALPVEKPFGAWMVLGLFNADEHNESRKTVSLERIGLDPAKTYIAYDFWKRKFFGEIRGEFDARQDPASVQLLAIHEKRGVPQVISTDRHITQGAIEIESAAWDAEANVMRGVSLGPVGSDHRVYVYVPEAVSWHVEHRYFPRESASYTAKRVEPNIIRVHVRFTDTDRVAWEIKPADH